MELIVKRKHFTSESTIGELFINGKFFCYTLEDTDRHIFKDMPLNEIAATKIKSQTAIPYGKYDLAMTYSNRFKQYMPQVLDVPCFDGIRIHSGNKAVDTEGCLLVGETFSNNFIGNSKTAFSRLMTLLKSVEKKEKITIEYVKE